MANAGFNAATDLFGMGTKWAVKSSNENGSGSVAEAPNSDNDVTHRDAYAQRIAPTAEYELKEDTTTLPALGTIVTVGTKKVAISSIVIKTSKGAAPSATVTGVQVEDGATTGRTYSCGTIALSARHKAQDILNLIGTGTPKVTPKTLTESTFTFAVDVPVSDPKGVIVSSDVGNGRVVAAYTHTSGDGTAVTPPTISGSTTKVVSAPASKASPENDYITTDYSITDSLTGSEPEEDD